MNTDRELIQSVIETLRQGEILLAELSNENYTCKVAVAFNASIGGITATALIISTRCSKRWQQAI
jgi:hypothetical protein